MMILKLMIVSLDTQFTRRGSHAPRMVIMKTMIVSRWCTQISIRGSHGPMLTILLMMTALRLERNHKKTMMQTKSHA